ncbi:class I ribonucleotide reductase maintenance protein YfaE [Neisseria sp.]|uniref:class I ribonucleotide reductase maintenance protein YfaE n=1 Tax=Neisseria sp. TaxID=192066 RepID=UPI0035A168AE
MPHITTHDKIFELQEGETLLEGLERTGHDVEYQCRSGYCGSCRVKILAGRVEYDNFPLAFVAPGEILPCCCRTVEDITLDCRSRTVEPDLFDVGLFDADGGENG